MRWYFIPIISIFGLSCKRHNPIVKLETTNGFYLKQNSSGFWISGDNQRSYVKACEKAKGYIYNETEKTGYIVSEDETVVKFCFLIDKNGSQKTELKVYTLTDK